MEKPYSPSCDRNKDIILEKLGPLFSSTHHVLEIGSGTGQHAVHFARHLPHLIWQTSDRLENHSAIKTWLDEAGLSNTRPPLDLDVSAKWPKLSQAIDAIFSANAVHIMSWENVCNFIKNTGIYLAEEGLFVLYGPFNYGGKFTSLSNEKFDLWLKNRNPESGIRDFEAITKLAQEAGLWFEDDIEMPANNRILVFTKK